MKIACVRVPNFALRVALLDRPQLAGAPLALVSPEGVSTIADCTPEAAARGVRPGIYPREATSLCPNIVLISSNPIRDEAVFGRIVDRLEALSPLIEPGEPGCCYVDLHGLERHFNGLEDLAGRLCQTAPSVFRPRVGIAPGKFAARVAAGRALPGAML
jgi:nucleotidyltransferase/DNA polymerase involved in DNA repair